MITTILLDAGGVILDETEHEKIRADIITGLLSELNAGYSLERYYQDVNIAVDCHVPRVYEFVIWRNTKDPVKYFKISDEYKKMFSLINPPLVLMKGIKELLTEISRNYRINIAGQYGRQILDLLENNGLIDFFETRITQDDFHLTKPDPRFYDLVLKRIGRAAGECIMIGDRIDKDVIPARLAGLKTIRMRTGLHVNQEPRIYEEYPDEEANDLSEISGKIEKIAKEERS
jgi:HAD superfamily hydrolase (TIGR01549 family)